MAPHTPELLAPAGSMASLCAAIDGGADAVYFGARAFNARMRADNFDTDALSEALSLCRAFGVRAYITLNTRITDRQLADAAALAAQLHAAGADAFIVADAGLAALLRRTQPDIVLHASTQMSAHTEYDGAALSAAGFSRMVCPRELSRESLARLCRTSPIPIEMFVHGAHCVSFSGQCLMSAVMGGRSGNRGECAQPCRLPYNGGYPLSLKDLCLASHIPEILATGVFSLKLEGRQKSPEYVYTVTRIWRTLLDEARAATPAELQALSEAFSRDGFSDGYFTKNHKNMLGVRTLEAFHRAAPAPYEVLSRRVPLDVTLTVTTGAPATLTAVSPEKTVTVCTDAPLTPGDVPPPDAAAAEKNAGRLGNTPFRLNHFAYHTDGAALFTLSMLNKLRRSAVEALLAPPARTPAAPGAFHIPDAPRSTPVYTAEYLSPAQITPLAREIFSEIYLPAGRTAPGCGVSLPPFCPGEDLPAVWEEAASTPYVLAHTPGQLYEAVSRGIPAHASLRFSVYNSETAAALADSGAASVCMSPELSLAAMKQLHSPVPKGAVVYGRLPLMLTLRCALSDGGHGCGNTRGGALRDRKGVTFPVTCTPRCENIVWNSVPVYMADRMDILQNAGVTRFHFLFTTETAAECDAILRAYRDHLPPTGAVMRVK